MMEIWIKAPHGTEVQIELDTEGVSPDGVDTMLRQVLDVYEGAIKREVKLGITIPAALDETPEFETVLRPDEILGLPEAE